MFAPCYDIPRVALFLVYDICDCTVFQLSPLLSMEVGAVVLAQGGHSSSHRQERRNVLLSL